MEHSRQTPNVGYHVNVMVALNISRSLGNKLCELAILPSYYRHRCQRFHRRGSINSFDNFFKKSNFPFISQTIPTEGFIEYRYKQC